MAHVFEDPYSLDLSMILPGASSPSMSSLKSVDEVLRASPCPVVAPPLAPPPCTVEAPPLPNGGSDGDCNDTASLPLLSLQELIVAKLVAMKLRAQVRDKLADIGASKRSRCKTSRIVGSFLQKVKKTFKSIPWGRRCKTKKSESSPSNGD